MRPEIDMNQLRPRARLLAIDDHTDSAELIARVAAKLGYDSRVAASSNELRDALGSWRPDILTLDLSMPEEDGLGVFAFLQEQGFGGRIVIISGHDEWLRRAAGRLASAKGLNIAGNLSKPIDLKVLRGLLTELVAESGV
jgi:CheY-like chemotaxis protein